MNTEAAPPVVQTIVVVQPAKSMAASYLFWFFLGWLGAHRLYHGKIATGVMMACLYCLGWTAAVFLVGFLLLVPLWIWQLIDAFLIPGWVRASRAEATTYSVVASAA